MKSTLTTFYIVRHGQTEWNVLRRIQGHSDIDLTVEGEAQAKLAAADLRHIKFDYAFSSDLIRAHRTAEIIAAEHKLAVKTTELLRERMYGEYEGKQSDELGVFYSKLSELLAEEQDAHREKVGMEGDVKVVGRFITFLRETALAYPCKTILVVSHGGMMRSLITHVAGVHDPHRKIRIQNTGYIKLQTDGSDFFLKETNGVTMPDGVVEITAS